MRVRPSVCLPLTEQDLGSARGVHGCTYVCMGFSGPRCTLTRWRVQRQMHPPEVRVWAGWAGAFGAGKVRLLPSCPLSSSYVVPLADPRLLGVPNPHMGCACHALHRQERNAYSASVGRTLSSCGLGPPQSLTTQHETFPKTPSASGLSFCRRVLLHMSISSRS